MKRALVLCGGGSLGSYETGVWRFLREKGQRFEVVTGTSVGALNGAMYCSDQFEECENLWRNMSYDKVFATAIDSEQGFFSGLEKQKGNNLIAFARSYVQNRGADITPLIELMKRTIDPKKIIASPVEFGIVTVSYPSMREVDILMRKIPESQVIDYLLASASCWPVFPIQKIGDKRFIDGGYRNNLPIDFALRLGAQDIVAVVLPGLPKDPQHLELMRLPFVKTVKPSHKIGSFLDFDSKITSANMELGYLDALKAFDEAWGFEYTFFKDRRWEMAAEEIVYNAIKKSPYDFPKMVKALSYGDSTPATSLDIFVRALETMGSWFGIDYHTEYQVTAFAELIMAAANDEGNEKAPALPEPINQPLFALRPFEAADGQKFVRYLRASDSGRKKKEDFNERFFAWNPQIIVLKEIFAYWKAKGLLRTKK
jgi:predicted acylesterase/phospholipase RssA